MSLPLLLRIVGIFKDDDAHDATANGRSFASPYARPSTQAAAIHVRVGSGHV